MKKITILVLLTFALFSVKAQVLFADPSIVITMNPSTIQLNTNGILKVNACNKGLLQIVSNSLRLSITVGTNAQILGLETVTDNRWTIESITSGTNNTINLTNTNGTIAAGNCADINLTVKGTVIGGPTTITGNIAYIPGGNTNLLLNAQSSTQGNVLTSNDNASTSFTVTNLLAVKLASFDAGINECITELKWTSTSEINFSSYAVEYSNNGIKYDIISTIAGKGDNKNYSILHHPQNGKAFYRLKLIDKDNTYSYSKINLVTISCITSNVSVFPNPVSDILNVNISNFQSGLINGILSDGSGKKIISKQFKNGTNIFDVRTLVPGSYILTLYKQDGVESLKIFKY